MTQNSTKKRKRRSNTTIAVPETNGLKPVAVKTSKPSAIHQPAAEGRDWTLSIAVPGSVIANAQTHDLKCRLAATIARAASVFCVDEIVVFDDGTKSRAASQPQTNELHRADRAQREDDGHTGWSDPCDFLARLLAYLETPPHLRRLLFGIHADLRTAGSLPSLDLPHHPRAEEWAIWREGVVIASEGNAEGVGDVTMAEAPAAGDAKEWKPKRKRSRKKRTAVDPDSDKEDEDEVGPKSSPPPSSSTSKPSMMTPAPVSQPTTNDTITRTIPVDAGFPHPVLATTSSIHESSARVTLHFPTATAPMNIHTSSQPATIVPASTPRTTGGFYWGYTVRRAASLTAIFTECPAAFAGGYDLTIGTSERGVALPTVLGSSSAKKHSNSRALPNSFSHLMLVFGGVAGLESAIANDVELQERRVKDPREVFDYWVDLMGPAAQGSRTVRTEEAVWCGLMGLRGYVMSAGRNQ